MPPLLGVRTRLRSAIAASSLVILVTLSGIPSVASAVEQQQENVGPSSVLEDGSPEGEKSSPSEPDDSEAHIAEPSEDPSAVPEQDEEQTPSENAAPSDDAGTTEEASKVDLPDIQSPGVLTRLGGAEVADIPLPQPNLNRAVGAAYSCMPGMLYGVNRFGDIWEFNANTGAAARGVGAYNGEVVATATEAQVFNAVGVSPDGTNLRLMTEHVKSTILGIVMNVSAGSLAPSASISSFPHGWKSHSGNFSFVAGAVDPLTGDYVVGTVDRTSTNGRATSRFYRVASNGSLTEIGYFRHNFSQQQAQVTMNGDMSFDSNGDMYYMSSVEGRATLWKVPRQMLAGSNKGLLAAENTADFAIPIPFFNGFHIAGNGYAYASSERNVYQYKMSNWSLTRTFTNVLPGASTDLGGCSYPSAVSVKLQKNLAGVRSDPSDQFVLSLTRESQSPVRVTTSGQATGTQPQQAGPLTSVSGETFRIEESMAPGSASSLDAYESTWQCADQNSSVLASGKGTSGSFVLPALSLDLQVTCVFTNKPKAAATLTLIKEFDIRYGAPANPEQWTLTATVQGGKVPEEQASVVIPSGATKSLQTAGTYRLAESGPPGYELASVSCVVGGQTVPTKLQPPYDIELSGGVSATCTLLNRDLPGSINWTKVDDSEEPKLLGGSQWILRIPGRGDVVVEDNSPQNPIADGLDDDPEAGRFHVSELAWGHYTVREVQAPEGYVLNRTPRTIVIDGSHLSGLWSGSEASNVFVNEREFSTPDLSLPLTGARTQLVVALSFLTGIAAITLVARRVTRAQKSRR